MAPTQPLRELKDAEPGQRFERMYRKRQQGSHGAWQNAGFIVGGLLLVAAGVATYPVPVIPSEIVIVVGFAVLAQGSRRGAMILDATELRLRRWFAPAIAAWSRWPKWARIASGVAWPLLLGVLSWWVYHALED